MRLYTDEIVNAVCLNIAERKRVAPNEVEVELLWDEDHGFSAEIVVQERSQFLIEANLLESLEQYVYNQYNLRVFRSQISLGLDDEEFWADVTE
ncbi:DUF2653 family protein [Paenibacillaceae bacterium]|nr:DUF2653 family protein [Paenibacillaceae bacterium]